MSFDCFAIDIGASNGRVMRGNISEGVISVSELHRFPNNPVYINRELYWDILYIYREIIDSFSRCSKEEFSTLKSIGIDTFGMDFAFLDKEGKMLGNPLSYRGERGQKGKLLFDHEYNSGLFTFTGIADRHFNTTYQLYYMVKNKETLLDYAAAILFIPDLLAYFLTGNIFCDKSIASPGQVISLNKTGWNTDVFSLLGLDVRILPKLSEPAANRGALSDEIIEASNLPAGTELNFSVHDTAAALEAVPSNDECYAFISSGTWSLMGIKSPKPVVNEFTKKRLFSNICTLDNDYMILKNIMGIWILQCCKKDWEKESGTAFTWDELEASSINVINDSYIDVNNDLFFSDGNMVDRIKAYCLRTEQKVPDTCNKIVRTVIESLAMNYKETYLELLQITDNPIDKLYIVGGGSRHRLLNQITSNLIGAEVISGPAEATVIGSVLLQAIKHNNIRRNDKAGIIEKSFPIEYFIPQEIPLWELKWQEYKRNTARLTQ